ncbi:Cys-tRNA(Pro)/Cys-tRNA(Cys) deacylase [Sedimentibacter acidaminivorans]|jgi:Cys-tRNA(Pro)/Cys-tRNA(Cys) deacylase|uniref:Cys-tRNA(Pro)/Cys-tRNA(Cys) deacylase n=1 Tax=Sedimentibacter acidaminivorans TaxID=913099 RepID=A0ABS4GE18_9FIRM|nr:Cys-tRNA(Pro) deacylase [Sedimentibacter acidaminivorans]MBP1925924.1 Cys-tRNA(Pro)/Cys-tRNA(Cys) deacylase [Sedimentibacter acidaminivorans]
MKKINKTNAMRILDSMNIEYDYITYECEDGKIDGVSVALKTGQNPETVFKTLVSVGHSKELYVFCIPVEYELDLKKAAKASNEKNIELLPLKELTKNTGYIRGGCSPIGMKKHYKTFIDETASLNEKILVSAGCLGVQIIINPNDLIKASEASYEDLI